PQQVVPVTPSGCRPAAADYGRRPPGDAHTHRELHPTPPLRGGAPREAPPKRAWSPPEPAVQVVPVTHARKAGGALPRAQFSRPFLPPRRSHASNLQRPAIHTLRPAGRDLFEHEGGPLPPPPPTPGTPP